MTDLQHSDDSPLSRFTPARVGLARTGSALSTQDQLLFQLDHAMARDAVHDTPDFTGLLKGLRERDHEALLLESAIPAGANARTTYLRRPDLGRKLDAASAEALRALNSGPSDIAFVIADGLSALAIDRHAMPLLDAITNVLAEKTWKRAPITVIRNGRVAIADEIGALLKASLTVLLIGERPGLSAPDSLGVYLTWEPRPGRTDAERNCISNIRTEGLGYDEAARRIVFYMNAAREQGKSGFTLKEPPSPKVPAIG